MRGLGAALLFALVLSANAGATTVGVDGSVDVAPSASVGCPKTPPPTLAESQSSTDVGQVPALGPSRPSGVDVSRWNGSVPMKALVATGRTFVYVKATQGLSSRDPAFASRTAQANAAGLLTGAYHFFDYQRNGVAQADFFVDTVLASGGFLGHLPPAVDVECSLPLGRADTAYASGQLRAFVGEVYQRTGRMTLVYTSASMWSRVVANDRSFSAYPLWVACWKCASPTLPRGWTTWRFWQIGIRHIAGVPQPIDADVFRYGHPELLSMLMAHPVIDGGATYATTTTVDLGLVGSDGTHFRTSHDGTTWSSWQPYRASADAQLAHGDGPQTLYVQLSDPAGRLSPTESISIVLDSTPPQAGLDGPALALARMRQGKSSVPASVTWRANDATAGLATAELDETCAGRTPEVLARSSDSPTDTASATVADARSRLPAHGPCHRQSRTRFGPEDP